MQEKNGLKSEVLGNAGNLVARQFTTVFKNGQPPIETMQVLGIDFDTFYNDDSKELPVPTTFIIEQDSTISFT
ncbi:MAG: hypothetical protein AAFV80_17670 [Bacteroidota bacterium]